MSVERACNRLRSWRFILTRRVLGSRLASDPQAAGFNALFAEVLTQRAMLNALKVACLARGVFGEDRYEEALQREAELLDAAHADAFPGARSTELGIEIVDAAAFARTTAGWPR